MPGDIDTSNKVSVSDATAKLVTQFDQTVAEQQQARAAAEGCEAALASQWGGQASGAYRHALASWTANLDQVRVALMDLQNAMNQYSKNTATTEDDNLQSVTRLSQMVASSASWT